MISPAFGIRLDDKLRHLVLVSREVGTLVKPAKGQYSASRLSLVLIISSKISSKIYNFL